MKQSEALELIRIGVETLTGKVQTIDRECTSNRAAVLLLADALDVGGDASASDARVASDAVDRIKELESESERNRRRVIELNGLLDGAKRGSKITYENWAATCATRDQLRQECAELRERLNRSESELRDARYEAEKASDSADLNAAGAGLRREQIAGLSKEVDRLKSENTTLRAQLAKEAEARAVAGDELAVMTGRWEAARLTSTAAQSWDDWQRIVERMAAEAGGYIGQIETLTRKLDRANTELGVTQGRLDASRERSEKLYADAKRLHVELSEMEDAAKKAKGRGMPDGFEVKQDGSLFVVSENGSERLRVCLPLMDREALSAHFIARAELDP